LSGIFTPIDIGELIGDFMTIQMRILGILILALTLAACGGDVVPTPTVPPPPTATPLSTPLPDVATAIPAGFNEDNPLRLVIVPADENAAEDLVAELQAQLAGRTDLSLEVELADSQPEALAAVCSATGGQVTAAWVDGLTLAAAVGQECGVPALQIQRGTDRNPETGEAGVILFNTEAAGENTALDIVPENTFCRTSYTDLYSWIVPTMMLRVAGIDIAALTDIDERADYDELVAGVSTGTCVVVGLPERVWETYFDDDSTLEETVTVAATSAEIPYGVLVVPFSASLDAINQLTEALLAIDVLFGEAEPAEPTPTPESEETEIVEVEPTVETEGTPEGTPEVSDESELAGQLAAFFGEGVLVRVDTSDFAEFNEFLASTGINFGTLGN
jgi:ABC-type phosphate/phosphonate transport system substrate-binding protein